MLKRWLVAAFIAGTLMVADGLALIAVTRAFLPHKPPPWATAPFFWSLAWSVQLFAWLFPRGAGDTTGGPTVLAVALGALLDLALLTLAVHAIRGRRTRRA